MHVGHLKELLLLLSLLLLLLLSLSLPFPCANVALIKVRRCLRAYGNSFCITKSMGVVVPSMSRSRVVGDDCGC